MTKYLWLLKRIDDVDYDEYDSCVVCADNKDNAAKIGPGYGWSKRVIITEIGTANENVKLGDIVCSSYNAG